MDVPAFRPERSREAVSTSRLRIVRSRQRIRASRVLTRPIQGAEGSGPTVTPIGIRRRIRTMIEIGALPALADRRSWIGQGRGEPCLLCEQLITAAHWEHEIDVPSGEIRAHAVCFRIWLEESEQRRKSA